MFKLDAIPRLSPEDARLLSNIGEIYNAREEFVGFGVLIDGGQFVTSYYYLTGEEGEYIQFYQQDEWKKFTYREMDLIRDENYNAAWILKLTAVDGGNLDPFSILDSASEEDMPGGEWSLTLLEPRWDEKKNPSLKRYELDAYVERYSLYYEEDALDSLAGLPLLIKGRLAGYHFGEMSGSSTEKTGVWWPGVHTRLREKLSSQRPKLGRIQELESKLETQDDNLEILNELAKAYRESENHGPEDAIPLLERALRLEPNNTFSLNEYGIQLRESGRVEEAINTFERALKTDPKNTFTINELAYTFGESLKNEEQAKKLYEQSLEIQPENIFALTHLARVEADLFNWENAEALIGQALEIAPENEDALAVQLIIRENKQQESGEEQTLQIESIREHLQRGDIEMALNLLEKLETGQSLPEGKIQILRARYLQTARQFSQGVITTQENEVQLNQISSQIMSLLQTVQEQVEGTSPSTGLSEQANNLEKQLESLTKQDSAQAREILHELSAVYQQLISQDKEEEYWRRQYGLTLERLGDLEVDEGNYEDAENHFQRAIVFFRNLQLNQQEKDWLNIAAAIAHEHLGDVRQLTADVNTALKSYESAIKQLEKLSERNPEHEDLGPTSTVLADKVAQMLEKAERYREADSYRNRLEVLFASSDSASQLQNLVKSILSDDFDKAVNELAAFAESGQNSKRFLPQISRIESDWTSLTGSAPNEECQKFVDQKFRLDLIEILLQIEPETEKLITLTEDRRNLFGAVLTYAEEDLPKRRPAAVVFLFESFKASFSPNNQETLENILRDWENISQRPAKRGGNRYGEITDRLQRLVQDAQFLNQPRSSTEEPDVQSELNRIIEMTAEIPHEEYLKAMDNFPVAQLPEELRGKWEKEIIPRLEDLRKNIESDYENLELVMKLNQEIQELLFDIRQELFPI
ncbi:MAG: tetratricopeptide repeat protein [Bacteroidetes bacterium]|nr:tetratricopeptide repeat protein [Bacteroidota bacterium]